MPAYKLSGSFEFSTRFDTMKLLLVILAIALPAMRVVEGLDCYHCNVGDISNCPVDAATLMPCAAEATEEAFSCYSMESSSFQFYSRVASYLCTKHFEIICTSSHYLSEYFVHMHFVWDNIGKIMDLIILRLLN